MSVVKDLFREEADGSISFGDYELAEKAKKSDIEAHGDRYKVKTFRESTRLEKNDALLYESEPGTAVTSFSEDGNGVKFTVEGPEDAQVILGMEDGASYKVTMNGREAGVIATSMGGKLVLTVELGAADKVEVEVSKI